jgi:hypothetical protein
MPAISPAMMPSRMAMMTRAARPAGGFEVDTGSPLSTSRLDKARQYWTTRALARLPSRRYA